MLENYEKLIKCMQVLEGFENYRCSNGYGGRLAAFSYPRISGSFEYKNGQLILISDKGVRHHVNAFMHQDRNRTPIASNTLKVGSGGNDAPYFNIQYSDDFLQITSKTLFKYNLEVQDLFEEEVHFQYSMIEDVPSIEVLTEAHEIFELLLNEDIGYIGPMELPYFDYDSFLRWMRGETIYVAKYWECLDV